MHLKKPRNPRFVAWVVSVLLLGFWGAWAGPAWNPQPMSAIVVPSTPDTKITTAFPTAKIGTYAISRREEFVPIDAHHSLRAEVTVPLGFKGQAPALVFIHGTGTNVSWQFREHTDLIASTGIITIVQEKRLDHYTTTSRDYYSLAEDYTRALKYISTYPGVDPHRIGVYGVSEGAFIAPIVCAHQPLCSDIILISPPVLPIRAQGALAADTYLRTIHAPWEIRAAIPKLMGGSIAGGFHYIDFDVAPYVRQLHQPVLVLYGTADKSMPTIQGPLELRNDLAKAGNHDLTVRYYKNATHGLKIDGVIQEVAMRDISDWVNGLPYTADALPHVAGAQPHQDYKAVPLQQPRWSASSEISVIILLAGLGLTAVTALVALIGVVGLIPIRGRQRFAFAPRAVVIPALRASLGVIFAWGTMLMYVIELAKLAVKLRQDDLIVHGGWLATQAISLLALWFIVDFVFQYRRTAAAAVPRIGRFARILAVLGLASQIVMIIALGYWGVFPNLL